MSTVKIIDSVEIDLFSREHPSPHFHALYAEFEELIEIETLDTYRGYLLITQRKKVTEWAREKRAFLMENFKRLNPRL